MKIIDSEIFNSFLEDFDDSSFSADEKRVIASFASISPFVSRYLGKVNLRQILEDYKKFQLIKLSDELEKISQSKDEKTFFKDIRLLKYREIVKIAIRDINNINSIEKTLEELSLLAELIIKTCCVYVEKFYYKSTSPLSIIAMGKLGARELNFSSDVDLIYVYDVSELDTVELYNKKAVLMNKLLSSLTEHGFLYRVDNDLRPGGRFSPLAMSGDAITNHYLLFGEAWQRVALLRARFLAGDEYFVNNILNELISFVYSKYLDFSLIDDLRKLKEKINNESLKKDKEGINIKLGKGGIREAEFFTQVIQIINGGKDINIRKVKFGEITEALAERKFISESDAEALKEAYYFLRKVENSIQMEEERQEYLLPKDEKILFRVVKRCGFNNIEEFMKKLDFNRNVVSKHFENLFEEKIRIKKVEVNMETEIKELLPDNLKNDNELLEIIDKFIHLRESVTSKYKESYIKFVYELIKQSLNRENGKKLLKQIDDFINILIKRQIYIPLLSENPQVIEKVIGVYNLGNFFVNIILNHPESLDFFILDRDDIEREKLSSYVAVLKKLVSGVIDFEDKMFLLRQFKNSEWLKIALLKSSGHINNRELELFLTNLAEATLVVIVDLCSEILTKKYGKVEQEFVIVGLGKLGTKEMNFHSDLDLIFIYRSEDEGASFYNTKLLQRVITALTMTTKEGYLYNVDMRLRPTGSQGPLVTSYENFVKYHNESAWVFEKQALTKARVLGDMSPFAEEVDKFIEKTVYENSYDVNFLKKEIKKMRKKIEEELSLQNKDTIEIKTGKGGLIDIDFIVQYIKLYYGKTNLSLRKTNTDDFFDTLVKMEILNREMVDKLLKAYNFLKKFETSLRIYSGYSKNELNLKEEVADEVIYSLGYDKSRKRVFFKDIKDITKGVRVIFDEIFS